MTKLAEQIFEQAKSLSIEEREELAARLMESVGVSTDPEYLRAWDAELARRIDNIDSGRTKLIPADEALQRIRQGRGNHGAPGRG